MDSIIITAAICGAEVTRDQTPHLPVTAGELGKEAKRCMDAGAAIIHLHVRKPDGSPSQDLNLYREAFNTIRKSCKVLPIIQPSTGGALGMSFEERSQPLELLPEMATLDCGTVNFGDDIFPNSLPMMRNFAIKMKEHDILPELECFEAGHVSNALILQKEGLLTGHLHFDFVLGVPGAMDASVDSLVHLARSIPADATWTTTGIGRHNLPIALMAIAMGGHVRTGLEDTIYYSRGTLSEGSAPLVERLAGIARETGRKVATAEEAREILGIEAGRKEVILF